MSLLRSASFFEGAAAGGPSLVLGVWVALGLGAVLLGTVRAPAEATEPAADHAPAPAG